MKSIASAIVAACMLSACGLPPEFDMGVSEMREKCDVPLGIELSSNGIIHSVTMKCDRLKDKVRPQKKPDQ